MELVAYVGSDKESWGQISGLINHGTWDKVIILRNKSTDDFPMPENAEEIVVDAAEPLVELKKKLIDRLKGKLKEFDAHVSIASGNGKEHMALISALLSLPVGIRLVVFTKNGIEFIT